VWAITIQQYGPANMRRAALRGGPLALGRGCVRATGADIARFSEARPATHVNGGAASAVGIGIGIGVAAAIAFGVCGKA